MKKNMCKNLAPFFFLLVFFAFSAASTFAAPPQPQPDLRVQLVGPTSAVVNSPYVYTVKVKNIGNKTAGGVQLVVTLPETDTSPQKYILGTLSGIQTGCQVVNRKLQCSLNSITPNQTKNVTFNLALPVSTKVLEIKANATTTTLPGDPNMSNNTDTLVPPIAYPTNQITSTVNVLNSHCTGRGLTSYFECELFQSSISYHTVTLNDNGTVSIGEPGFSGTWYQPTPQQLYFNYTENNVVILEFNGYAVSSTCFEGITRFIPDNGYISPYRVCVQ